MFGDALVNGDAGVRSATSSLRERLPEWQISTARVVRQSWGAASGAGGPIFGAVDWGEPVAVLGVDGGASGGKVEGESRLPGVGGEVEGGASAAVSDEGGAGGGGR